MLVLPADPLDVTSPQREPGGKVGGKRALVTFGIVPGVSATGYGYIEAGKNLSRV